MQRLNILPFYLIDRIENGGYEAFFVGGCVRDIFMNKDFDDADITTNAPPHEIKRIFSDMQSLDFGLKHGTITVVDGSKNYEITTYRTDCGYSDKRHPDSVKFCSHLSEDLKRRDFTVNALAYSPTQGLYDLFGGLSDIKNRVIRCIGSPEERFNEDALRILRALRFSSVLDFRIEKKTAEAIHALKEGLKDISRERIFSELKKLLCGKNVRQVLIEFYDVFELIIPQISKMKGFDQHNFHHKYDILCHTATVVESVKAEPDLRLAALFHDCAKPDCFSIDENGVGHFYSHASVGAKKAHAALKQLKADNATTETVTALVKYHDGMILEDEKRVKRFLYKFGAEFFLKLIELQRADTMGLADEFKSRLPHFDNLEKIAQDITEKEACFSLKDLAANGNDIMTLGYSGKRVGDTLAFLLDSVIDGKVENERSDLLSFLKDNFR